MCHAALQEEGYELQCRWCGVGGDLVGCDNCIASFCQDCVTRNLGKKGLNAILKDDDWNCFQCNPKPTAKLKYKPLAKKAVSFPGAARVQHVSCVCSRVLVAQRSLIALQVSRTTSKSKKPAAKQEKTAVVAAEPEIVEEPAAVEVPEEVPAPAVVAVVDVATLKKMTVVVLRGKLKDIGLDTSGKKDFLIKRLHSSMVAAQEVGAADASDEAEEAPKEDLAAADSTEEAEAAVAVAAAESEAAAAAEAAVAEAAAEEEEEKLKESAATAKMIIDSPRRQKTTPKTAPAKPRSASKAAAMEEEEEVSHDAPSNSPAPSPSKIGLRIGAAVAEPKKQQAPSLAQDRGQKRKLNMLLCELDVEVESRCELLQNNATSSAETLRNKFKTQLARLPKKARAMTLVEFCEQYGTGVQATIMDDIRARLADEGWAPSDTKSTPAGELAIAPTPAAGSTRRSSRRSSAAACTAEPAAAASRKRKNSVSAPDSALSDKENMMPKPSGRRSITRSSTSNNQLEPPPTPAGLKTPAFAKNLPQTPATEGRYPRRGESLMSANGSPVGIYGGARATFGEHAAAVLTAHGATGASVPASASDNRSAAGRSRRQRRERSGRNCGPTDLGAAARRPGGEQSDSSPLCRQIVHISLHGHHEEGPASTLCTRALRKPLLV